MSDAIDPNVLLLLKNQSEYFEKLLAMHRQSFDDQFKAEAKRIDGRQAADAEMVKVANQAAIKQAENLAIQVAENAETLRKGMEESAKTLATQLQTTTGGLDGRLKVVETNQYTLAGTSKGKGDMWGYVFGGIMLIIAVVGFFWDKF